MTRLELVKIEAAARALAEARDRLDAEIRAALAAGVSNADIGRAAGLTRQRISQIRSAARQR